MRALGILLLSFQAFGFDPILEPTGEHDFGLSVTQTANAFVITPEDIVWMDGDRMRKRYQILAGSSDQEIKLFLTTQPVAHQTVLQSAWEGILMETLAQPAAQFTVTHPPLYIRGGFL